MKENKGNEMVMTEPVEVEPTREREELAFTPATDIYEKDDAILVRCDMPGVKDEQLEITLENYELTIIGRQESAQMGVDYDLLTNEYDTGTLRRTFKVPQQIDRDKIKARLHNGVLDVELPKTAQAKPQKIKITTGT